VPAFLLLIFTIFVGYFLKREDFTALLVGYGGMFGVYFWVIWRCYMSNSNIENQVNWLKKNDFKVFIYFGIFLRFVLLFPLPNLSDDFYRFLWDGRLTMQGIHPFLHQPAYFLENPLNISGLTPDFIQKLNSQHYYTVYPPLCQGLFAFVAWIFPTDIFWGVFLMKFFLLLCEIGTIFFLYKIAEKYLKNVAQVALIYALNPLAIVEIVGNCHFEGAMLFFTVAGLWYFLEKRLILSAILFSFSIAFKLLPLLFLPILLAYLTFNPKETTLGTKRGITILGRKLYVSTLGLKASITFLGTLFLVLFILFIPLYNLEVIQNMGRSLDHYFQKFEFNASVYYVLRQIGFWYKGYNIGYILAPIMGIFTFLSVLALAFWKTAKTPEQLFERLFFASMIYLLLSSTVHPWYVLVPMLLSSLTQFRFAILWSGMAILSYSHYSNNAFLENYWLIFVEYLVLLCTIIFYEKKHESSRIL
jgi:alpha-1,6-mannosyltransferase